MNENAADPTLEALAEIREKYRLEREKRLRPDGTGQYQPLDDIFADFDRDPNADPDFTRAPVIEQTEAVLIGAGLGSLMAAAGLVKKGVERFRIIDRAGDFGGTWYWNRYPGAACDVESYIYLPLLEETGYIPIEKYSKAPEIFAHCQRVGRHFGLYEKALFQTVVDGVRWSDTGQHWEITTDRGDKINARFVIIAGGILHKAKLPGIPGIENFKGKMFHTSRWDYAYTGGAPGQFLDRLGDKRVAVIGTGATAVQVVPKVAEAAQQLYVFQRTPAAVGVRNNRPTDPEWVKTLEPGWQAARMENFSRIVSGEKPEMDMVQDGWTDIFGKNPNAWRISGDDEQLLDLESMQEIRARIDEIVTDPQTADALKPWYNRMCKRPCFHDEYLPSFNRPNVTLVDTSGKGVERITEDAVIVDGVAYPVDCIVFASGFDPGGMPAKKLGFEIHGRSGVPLGEAWADGPGMLHGVLARGFPNLMFFHVVQTGIAINFAHLLSELAEYAAWLISHSVANKINEFEPAEDAQEAWFHTLISQIGTRANFFAECTPGFYNGEGSLNPAMMRSMPYFGPILTYMEILRLWREPDHDGNLAGLETR